MEDLSHLLESETSHLDDSHIINIYALFNSRDISIIEDSSDKKYIKSTQHNDKVLKEGVELLKKYIIQLKKNLSENNEELYNDNMCYIINAIYNMFWKLNFSINDVLHYFNIKYCFENYRICGITKIEDIASCDNQSILKKYILDMIKEDEDYKEKFNDIELNLTDLFIDENNVLRIVFNNLKYKFNLNLNINDELSRLYYRMFDIINEKCDKLEVEISKELISIDNITDILYNLFIDLYLFNNAVNPNFNILFNSMKF